MTKNDTAQIEVSIKRDTRTIDFVVRCDYGNGSLRAATSTAVAQAKNPKGGKLWPVELWADSKDGGKTWAVGMWDTRLRKQIKVITWRDESHAGYESQHNSQRA